MAVIPQVEIEDEIRRLSDLAEKVTTELAHRATEDAEARVDYKVAMAQSMLLSRDEGGPRRTVQEVEAIAIIATQDQFRRHAIAEARFKAAQEAGRNYRAQLDALRSINANHRALVTG